LYLQRQAEPGLISSIGPVGPDAQPLHCHRSRHPPARPAQAETAPDRAVRLRGPWAAAVFGRVRTDGPGDRHRQPFSSPHRW